MLTRKNVLSELFKSSMNQSSMNRVGISQLSAVRLSAIVSRMNFVAVSIRLSLLILVFSLNIMAQVAGSLPQGALTADLFKISDSEMPLYLSNKALLDKSMKRIDDTLRSKLANYATYIKLDLSVTNQRMIFNRLLSSSTQFILCDQIEDWSCLEKKPELVPNAQARIEVLENLGQPVRAGRYLDIEYFFTKRWKSTAKIVPPVSGTAMMAFSKSTTDNPPVAEGAALGVIPRVVLGSAGSLGSASGSAVGVENPLPDSVASELAKRIMKDADKKIWAALYGIDDALKSMRDVFQALLFKAQNKVGVQVVLDVSAEQQVNGFLRDYDVDIMTYKEYLSLPVPPPVSSTAAVSGAMIANIASGAGAPVVVSEELPTVRILNDDDIVFVIKTSEVPIDFSPVFDGSKDHSAYTAPHWVDQVVAKAAEIKAANPKMNLRDYLARAILVNPKGLVRSFELKKSDLTWLMTSANLEEKQNLSRVAFQYQDNLKLFQAINEGQRFNPDTGAHLEFPFDSIMHNKFLVLQKKSGSKTVWTGTANVAKTCMGTEENANMSIYIKNDIVAQAFVDEFSEMYGSTVEDKKPTTLLTGLYHNKKHPNTKRYFLFDDGTEVRVHFSPTDDAEHRVILPMIYSAREGDILRISMFGGSGLEIVRALQSAVARGVQVRIAMDSLTGSISSSWWKSSDGNVLQANPYIQAGEVVPRGKIEVRLSTWKGLNHYKVGSLTRRLAKNIYKPEMIIIGSQNWSSSGNDVNDENVVSIRNYKKSLDVIRAFNQEFDSSIWPLSVPVVAKEIPQPLPSQPSPNPGDGGAGQPGPVTDLTKQQLPK